MTTSMNYLARWQSMWQQLGIKSPSAELLADVMQRYAEPHRHYHTMQHLDECLAQIDAVRHDATHPAEIELALWFHDAIYDVKGHNNEQQSADWARSVLLTAGGSMLIAERVHALVMVTCHNALPISLDEQILVDVDLSILAAKLARFAEYETQVRAEYAWVPEATYRSKRVEILQTFLDRETIYNTAYFKASSETSARRNLAASIANLLR
jgi:predicted metal-dependent HD superfamily phosphohydrolase